MLVVIEHKTQDCNCTGKVCSDCNKILCILNFHIRLSYRNWRTSICSVCKSNRYKIWYQNNKKEINITRQIYYDTANGKNNDRIQNHKRRTRIKNSLDTFTLQQWEELKQIYNYTCLCCKKKEPEIQLEIDHVIPLSKHGSNDISNIQPLCRSCNANKRTKIVDYRDSWLQNI